MAKYGGLFSLFLMLLVLTGCDNNRFYESNKIIENGSWNYLDAADFEFDVTDTSRAYNLICTLRNGTNYGYSNIWLFMNYSGPSGFISTDTLEFPLAYPDGRWIGTGAGDMVDTRFSFGRNFKFSEPGIHKVSFKHGMRYDDLSPVFDIGLRIEYADEKD